MHNPIAVCAYAELTKQLTQQNIWEQSDTVKISCWVYSCPQHHVLHTLCSVRYGTAVTCVLNMTYDFDHYFMKRGAAFPCCGACAYQEQQAGRARKEQDEAKYKTALWDGKEEPVSLDLGCALQPQ